MVCHCSHRTMESLEPSEKNWMSSGNNKSLTRLCATLPPWAHILTLAIAGRGLPPSVNIGSQLSAAREEEATSMLPWAVGWGLLTCSRIIILPEGQGGFLVGASLITLSGWSSTGYFFFCRPNKGGWGGVESLARVCWGWADGQDLDKYRSAVNILLVTISASCSTSATSCSAACAWPTFPSTGICSCSLKAQETRSANSSLIRVRSSAVVQRRLRSRASPVVSEGHRKLACRMSM